MAGQLIPPPEMDEGETKATTPQQRIVTWLELLGLCEQFLLDGLRRRVGPEGDVRSAY